VDIYQSLSVTMQSIINHKFHLHPNYELTVWVWNIARYYRQGISLSLFITKESCERE